MRQTAATSADANPPRNPSSRLLENTVTQEVPSFDRRSEPPYALNQANNEAEPLESKANGGGNSAGSPDDQPISNGAEPPLQQGDIFDNLDALRLDPTESLIGAKELLTHVPVRKPSKDEFFRQHPDPAYTLSTATYEDRNEREVYLVPAAMRPHLAGFLKQVVLALCRTRQGVLFWWPIPLPTEDGNRGGGRAWGDSARAAADEARGHWVSLRADMALGAYRVFHAEGSLPDPIWPEEAPAELLRIAFRGRIIDHPDHPVIRRLRGLV
jgi:hypothetical protein